MDFGYTPSLARGTIDAHVQLHELILSFFFKKKKKKKILTVQDMEDHESRKIVLTISMVGIIGPNPIMIYRFRLKNPQNNDL